MYCYQDSCLRQCMRHSSVCMSVVATVAPPAKTQAIALVQAGLTIAVMLGTIRIILGGFANWRVVLDL